MSRATLWRVNDLATAYVKLVLAMGLHDADYVDAYHGPQEWRADVERERPALHEVHQRATALAAELDRAEPPLTCTETAGEDINRLRHTYLTRQLAALIARAEQLQGRRFTFDEESRALYDAVSPHQSEEELAARVSSLEQDVPAIPGSAGASSSAAVSLQERLAAYRRRFIIPPDRLDAVFAAAIDECQRRTAVHVTLPPGESFTVEQVTGKSWSGYNWYQGDFASLIQVNVDLPIFLSRALDLAAHEGYPGHHVYNVLLERHLVRERGWPELTVYALFSPQSLIAEGTANFGVDVVMPPAERLAFERETLYPHAGLDATEAERYHRIEEQVAGLTYAGNEVARRYLDGALSAEDAAGWLARYTLTEPERARQRVRFIDQYRSYVINYNLGKDLVRRHVEARGGTPDQPGKRWEVFIELLTTPRVPSTLTAPAVPT
ncbi:MAG: FIG00482145: hypothetical protein [uncultured Chloroflexi bacterium]|uniref:DUF885 domain-containing protein n=1 Tax=uncultured Chloroflexota bacterium TaxID=166587 RepID=A0A6J4HG94_9CHLR|nr:MAG: FIG00482145: hypothetical protein [uncultured Chloroflexota bacterium]